MCGKVNLSRLTTNLKREGYCEGDFKTNTQVEFEDGLKRRALAEEGKLPETKKIVVRGIDPYAYCINEKVPKLTIQQ